MALKITDNFDHTSDQPNFKRDQFTTIAEMKACTVCDDGHLSYCKEDGKRYEFKSTNTFSDTTGYWAEFQAGGGGASDADEVTYDSTKETHTAGSVGAEIADLSSKVTRKVMSTTDDVSYDESVPEYYIEIDGDTVDEVLDWRGQSNALSVYVNAMCRREVTIYFDGAAAATIYAGEGVEVRSIGDINVTSGYEYCMCIQDGVYIIAPMSTPSTSA